MTKLQAAFAIQAINVEFCLEIYQIFKGVTGVQEIADLIAIGVLSRHLSQMLMVEAESRSMRVSSLIILILKGYKLLKDNS